MFKETGTRLIKTSAHSVASVKCVLIKRSFPSDSCHFDKIARPLMRKFMECSINSPALSLSMKHLVIGQRLKTPNFAAFHWSPSGSLVSIGQHFVATRVVPLPKVPKQV